MKSKILKYVLCSMFTTVALSACGGNSTSGSDNNNSQPNINEVTENVSISQTSRMPIMSGSGHSFEVMIRNNSKEAVKLSEVSSPSHSYKMQKNINGLKTDLYDFAACSNTLLANQSCVAKVTPQDDTGGFVVKAEFHGVSTGKSYSAVQVFNYGQVTPQNGFSIDSSTIAVEEKDNSSYYLSIPFVLDGDYSDVKVKSSIIPAETPVISCSGSGFSKGNSCTAHLLFKGGKYSNKIVLSGITGNTNLHATKSALSATRRLQAGDGSIDSAPVYVNVDNNAIGNLVHNGSNAVLTYGVRHPINIVNNGLAALTINTIAAKESDTSIDNGNCSGTLNADSSCTFYATSSSKTNGTGQITINSSQGNSVFNVIKLGNSSAPGLIMSGNGNFTYTVNGESREVLVSVLNNSTTDTRLTNLGFTTLNAPFTFSTYTGAGSSCDITNGTTELAQGESCNLVIKYSPTAVTAQNSLDFAVRGNYFESDGVTNHTLTSKISINYSAIARVAHISFTPSTRTMTSIRADGAKYTESTITLTNDGGTDATGFSLDTSAFTDHSLTVTNNGCNVTTLPMGDSCTVGVKFGPVTTDVDYTANVIANYKSTPVDGTASTTGQIVTSAKTAALIQVSDPIVTADAGVGYALSGNAYQFYPSPSQYLRFKFIYTNAGAAAANSFNVTLGDSIPAFAEVDSANSTCATGSTGNILNPGENCTMTLRFMNDQYLQVFGPNQSASLYTPGYSYKDTNTGINVSPAGTVQYAIQAKPWASVSTSSESVTTSSIKVNFSETNIAPSPVTDYIITYKLTDYANSGFTSSNATCNNPADNSCSVTINYPSYLPKGDYYLKWEATSGGSAANIPLTGVVKVTAQ